VSTLSAGELLQLKRMTTPTVYNGWEQITECDRRTHTNVEEARDYMPQFGPMVGYVVTVVCEPSNAAHQAEQPDAPSRYRHYVASVPGPKIVVVQDLDKPRVIGSFWGEVNAGMHRALGCVGTITDGAIRDVGEMTELGFKALAARLCVGHSYSWPVRWNCEVEVFGCKIQPGQLIHADQHGFLVIPPEDQPRILEASRVMDANECDTVICAGRHGQGKTSEQMLESMDAAARAFSETARQHFSRRGEWA
jgi:regulator of RNase E activity RraA